MSRAGAGLDEGHRDEFRGTPAGRGTRHVACPTVNGEEWLAGYRDRLTDLQARTARAQDALARAEATVTSPDGAVTVTVGPTGALRGLVLAERAAGLSRAQLAATVLATARTAQDRAAREAMDAAAPLLGGDARTAQALRAYLSEPGGRP